MVKLVAEFLNEDIAAVPSGGKKPKYEAPPLEEYKREIMECTKDLDPALRFQVRKHAIAELRQLSTLRGSLALPKHSNHWD